MIFPEFSRLSMPILLAVWSIAIVPVVKPSTWLAAAFVGFSMVVGFRFHLMRRVEDDKRSYNLYNVSSCGIYVQCDSILTFTDQMWLSLAIVHISSYRAGAVWPTFFGANRQS